MTAISSDFEARLEEELSDVVAALDVSVTFDDSGYALLKARQHTVNRLLTAAAELHLEPVKIQGHV